MMPTRRAAVLTLAAATIVGGCTARIVATGRIRVAPIPRPTATPTQPPPVVASPVEIAGTPVVRVGVNFEDQGAGGDADYNDAVMCFSGTFKVDGATVISTAAQDVVATTSSISACRHTVRVEVFHPDGRVEPPIVFASDSGAQVPMRFELGSRLEVSMQVTSGGCSPVGHSMHEAAWAQVLLDRCNTTGR